MSKRVPLFIVCAGVALAGCEGVLTSAVAPGSPGAPPETLAAESWPAHLLTSGEYNVTVHDLLGTSSRPADYFPAVSATEFDANVGVLEAMSAVQAEAVFNAARDLVTEAFANPATRAQVMTCGTDDDACVSSIITSLGRRTFRRTLDDDEVTAFIATYRSARADLEMNHQDAVAHVLRVMLSSPSFFLRIERQTGGPIAIEPAALASRLSFLLWGSMPDDALLDAAESGALDDDEVLKATVDRMLTDRRGVRFTERFLGQWLGTIRLSSHFVDPTVYPAWSPTMATAVERQSTIFLSAFVTGQTPWKELFTAPHPADAEVNPLLTSDPLGLRRGFLTLPAYLTLSSHSDRTSPTARAKGVVTSLFCTDMTPPPGVDTNLPEDVDGGSATPKTVRARLEAHRANPTCAGCHNILDPLGLSLENFDGIGRYRTQDEGQPIDASGTYRGTFVNDVSDLIPLLAEDQRLITCAPRKLFAFAMRRSMSSTSNVDEQRVQKLVDQWQGATMRELVHEVVVSPAFRGHEEEVSR